MRTLFWEYLEWANAQVNQEFGGNSDIKKLLEEDMLDLAKFFPPDGRLLFAESDGRVIGLACLRKIRKDTVEVKRMYVRKDFRRSGIGQALLTKVKDEAQEMGYPTIRLDSAGFMKAAHSLYQSNGFYEIDPYPESEIPEAFQKHWLFMEKRL